MTHHTEFLLMIIVGYGSTLFFLPFLVRGAGLFGGLFVAVLYAALVTVMVLIAAPHA